MSLRRVTVEELVPVAARRANPTAGGRLRFQANELGSDLLRLDPLGVGGILDRGLDLVLRRFAPCVLVSTVTFLPFQLGGEIALSADSQGLVTMLWALVDFVPQMITIGFVTHYLGSELLGRATSVRGSLEVALRRLPSASLVYLPWLLLTTIGYACCLLPGLVLAWLGSTFLPTYLLERDVILARLSTPGRGVSRWLNGLMHSLARSMRLVRGGPSFLRWVGWFAVLSAVNLFIVMTPAGVESPPVREQLASWLGADSGLIFLVLALFGASFFGLAATLTGALAVVYYVDQRVRKEGLDFELAHVNTVPEPAEGTA